MTLRDFIEQLEELEDDYGNLEVDWKLKRVEREDLRRPVGKDLSEVVKIKTGVTDTVMLSEGDRE